MTNYLFYTIDLLKEWQTLTTGILALLAAWGTFRAINKQIKLQKEQIDDQKHQYDLQKEQYDLQREQYDLERQLHERRELRTERVARAELPDALSAITLYAREYAEHWRANNGGGKPELPSQAITMIKRAVGAIDDESADTICEFVEFFQIHNARTDSQPSDTPLNDRLQRTYDALKLQILAEQIFPFARREADSIEKRELNIDDFSSAARICFGFQMAEQDPFLRYLNSWIRVRLRTHTSEDGANAEEKM